METTGRGQSHAEERHLPSLRRVLRELFAGVCRHRDPRYHLQLVLSGSVAEESVASGSGGSVFASVPVPSSESPLVTEVGDVPASTAAEMPFPAADTGSASLPASGPGSVPGPPPLPLSRRSSAHSAHSSACVLRVFTHGKRFFSREVVDELYCRFLERWAVCGPGVRAVVIELCRRNVMTRHVFALLAYFYVVRCLERAARVVCCLYLRPGMSARLEVAFRRYSRTRVDALLDNFTWQGISDLHYYAFAFPFALPVPCPTSSPCPAFLRAREYETGCDLPVFHPRRRAGGERPSGPGVGADVEGLIRVLRDRCRAAPCGNPFFVMARVFVERFCRRRARFLVPLGARGLRGPLRPTLAQMAQSAAGEGPASDGWQWPGLSKISIFAASVALRHGLISSLIDLPVWCYCKTKCERYATAAGEGALEAILCDNCGHCLNLGKEKLEGNHAFALNCLFYYRDRQEKSVIYSTHGDTAHCSLCGNQYLSRERIYGLRDVRRYGLRTVGVRWRAVLGSNAACGIFGPGTRLDVLVPCSSRTCYGTVVLRGVGVEKLLRLVSHGTDFSCQVCQSACRETCLDRDLEPDFSSSRRRSQRRRRRPCAGCRLYLRFSCAARRRRSRQTAASAFGASCSAEPSACCGSSCSSSAGSFTSSTPSSTGSRDRSPPTRRHVLG